MEEQPDNVQKDHVEGLYTDRLEGKKNRQSLAQLLHSVERDSLSGTKFLNELLQNADDACEKAKVDVGSVTITLTKNYLIFMHNGQAFDSNDVEQISDCANPNRAKLKDSNQIGNKGIGFKAVFSVSPYVLIRSNQYSFRFDKSHSKWKNNPEEWPWEITPIWTDESEIPVEVSSQIRIDEKVMIILKIDDSFREEIQKELNRIMSDAGILIFLRRIKQIKLINSENSTEQLLTISQSRSWSLPKRGSVTVYDENVDKVKKSQWYVYKFIFKMSDVLKKQLSEQKNLAEKYKNMTGIPVSLAIRIVNNKIIMPTGSKIYCYLPTDISWKYPFYFNSEFLLDSGRSALQPNDFANLWNSEIVKLTFILSFYFMECLARDADQSSELWKEVVKLLIHPNNIQWGRLNGYKQSFDQFFNSGLELCKILRDMISDESKAVSTLKYDKYGFVKEFGDEKVKKSCAHEEIQGLERLLDYGLKNFDISDIIQYLSDPSFQKENSQPESNIKLLRFLFGLSKALEMKKDKSEYYQFITKLKDEKFILSRSGVMKSPKDICSTDNSLSFICEQFSYIPLLHPRIEEVEEELLKWINSLGVSKLTFRRIVEETNKNEQETDRFVIALVACHSRQKLKKDKEQDQYSLLANLKVKTTKGKYVVAKKCHLPNSLKPKVALEDVVPDHDFIDISYLESNQDQSTDLKTFFIMIGANEVIGEACVTEIINSANKSPQSLQPAVIALFNAFQNSAAVKKALGRSSDVRLLLFGRDGKRYSPENLYLPDILGPEYKLESSNLDIPILSYPHITSDVQESEIRKWHDFFIAVGVKGELSLITHQRMVFSKIVEFPLGRSYFNSTRAGYDDNQPEYYFDIAFIDKIINTAYFWLVLEKNWNAIKDRLNIKGYDKWGRGYTLQSNVIFLVELAINNKYPEKKPKDLFSPKLKPLLGQVSNVLEFADIPLVVTDEILLAFGFKTTLSLPDCYRLLKEVSKREVSDDIKTIGLIYEQFIKEITVEEGGYVFDRNRNNAIKLLNQTGSFISSENAYAFIYDENTVYRPSPNLLKRPSNITPTDFKRLCSHISVKTFTTEDLVVEASEAAESDVIQKIKDVLVLIIIFEAHLKDNITDESKVAYIQTRGKDLSDRLAELKIIVASKIVVRYDSIFSDEVECFHEAATNTLYYNNSGDIYVNLMLYELIHKYLKTAISKDDFVRIITSNYSALTCRYDFLSDSNYKLVSEALEAIKSELSKPDRESVKRSASDLKSDLLGSSLDGQVCKSVRTSDNEDISQTREADLQSQDQDSETMPSDGNTQFSTSVVTSGRGKRSYELCLSTSSSAYTSSYSSSSSLYSAVSASYSVDNPTIKSSKSSDSKDNDTGSLAQPEESLMQELESKRMFGWRSNAADHNINAETGRKGEQYVYDMLKKKYSDKSSGKAIVETKTGFTAEIDDGSKVELIWLNKKRESFKPYDMKLIKTNNGVSKERYIEIKSSLGDKKSGVFSSQELDFFKSRDNYVVYYVSNATSDSTIAAQKIKNLPTLFNTNPNAEYFRTRRREVVETVVDFTRLHLPSI